MIRGNKTEIIRGGDICVREGRESGKSCWVTWRDVVRVLYSGLPRRDGVLTAWHDGMGACMRYTVDDVNVDRVQWKQQRRWRFRTLVIRVILRCHLFSVMVDTITLYSSGLD